MSRARLLGLLLALTLLVGCGANAASGKSGAPEASPLQNDPGSPVYTDWSKLTPYEHTAPKPLYSRFEPYQGDALTARDDYGLLLPYLGAEPTVSNYIMDSLPLFGLVTADGRVVTEPVYASIYTVSRYVQGNPTAPFLLLQKGDPSAGKGNGRDSLAGEFTCTVAAPDGRWVRNFGIAGVEYVDETHVAIVQPDNSVTVLDEDGNTAAYFPGDALAPYLRASDSPYLGYEGGPSLASKDGVLYVEGFDKALEDWRPFCYFNLSASSLSPDPPEGFDPEWPEWSGGGSDGYGHSPVTDNVTGKIFYYLYDHGEGAADATLHIVDGEQQPLLSVKSDFTTLYEPLIWNGLCSAVQDGAFCYYDLQSGECIFRYPLRSNIG